MRQVVALGGNALLRRGELASAANQRRNVARAIVGLTMACDGVETLLVHGNGPQVGLLALQAEAYAAAPAYPLDMLGAETQGMIGYILAQELRNARPERPVAALLTQTLVDADDPAFQHPSGGDDPASRVKGPSAWRGSFCFLPVLPKWAGPWA